MQAEEDADPSSFRGKKITQCSGCLSLGGDGTQNSSTFVGERKVLGDPELQRGRAGGLN